MRTHVLNGMANKIRSVNILPSAFGAAVYSCGHGEGMGRTAPPRITHWPIFRGNSPFLSLVSHCTITIIIIIFCNGV